MDELNLLAEMREDVPADTQYPAAHRALLAEISGDSRTPYRGGRRWVRRPILISGVVAGAVAAGAVVAVASSGSEHLTPPSAAPNAAPSLRLVAVTDPMTLADNAATVAQSATTPAATQWAYVKMESTTSHDQPSGAVVQESGSHQTKETWTRVDMRATASVQHGKTVVSDQALAGTPLGWPTISYSYLNSLPTDPGRLSAVIRQNLASGQRSGKVGDGVVFDSVVALMENYTVLPTRLNAALYGVLARVKTVRLERTKDIAGRKVLGLYHVQDGMKTEIFVSPGSYAYAGQRRVMVADHTLHGNDGARTLHKGDILDDEAILVSKIVNSPGARS